MFAAVALLWTPAFTEEELNPAQAEAKASFEEESSEAVDAANEKCGTKLAIKSDFQSLRLEAWPNTRSGSSCAATIHAVTSTCQPSAWKAIAKKVSGASCLFGGTKPPAKKDGTNDATLRSVSLARAR
ncbi:hypothetical protein LY474_32860 [Myxococcus stipitatus]|uniref:hypothetical protein n=1 Tax=Myxococcus stipitatus TaxID=83455 RepID=UPI001F17E5ED|nr:hypothetical protein [Myxococcus stipitatus]MCE9672610.1 hypothetical protein [Myxococcus stipitatus]